MRKAAAELIRKMQDADRIAISEALLPVLQQLRDMKLLCVIQANPLHSGLVKQTCDLDLLDVLGMNIQKDNHVIMLLVDTRK